MTAAIGFVQTGPSSGCFDGNVGQCLTDVVTLPGKAVSGVGSTVSGAIGDVASSAWDSICRSFADAFTSVLQWFGGVFTSMPDPDLGSIRGVYAVSLTLGMIVAVILLLIQAGSVVWTRSGAPLAQALIGLPKAALASIFTLTVSAQIMAASDAVSKWIVTSNGTSMTAFTQRLTTLLALSSISAPGNTAIPSVLLLLFGLLGIVLVVVLWLELVLRNAVFCVLVAVAPISAAGQIGSATQEWWRKFAKAAIQLAIVKAVIALVFVVGFDMAGSSTGITGLVSGIAVLFMAVFAWPAVARSFTFTGAAMGGAMGVGAVVGAVANRSASGGPGIDPASFGQFSERQAMSANAARSGGGASSAGAAAKGGGAGAASAVSAAAGPAGVAVAAIQALHKTINTVASRMEQQAGHAGLDGANPTAYPGGYPSYGAVRLPGLGARSSSASSSSAEQSKSTPAAQSATSGKA
ncbi:MAG TPA: hypothetical protein VL551_04190 [Actinospica sp.]|nr:hypothetical protein [Actinospica sp.]